VTLRERLTPTEMQDLVAKALVRSGNVIPSARFPAFCISLLDGLLTALEGHEPDETPLLKRLLSWVHRMQKPGAQRYAVEPAVAHTEGYREALSDFEDELLTLIIEGVEPPPQYGTDVLCEDCAVVFCPHGERLHFDKDGCPACYEPDGPDGPAAAREGAEEPPIPGEMRDGYVASYERIGDKLTLVWACELCGHQPPHHETCTRYRPLAEPAGAEPERPQPTPDYETRWRRLVLAVDNARHLDGLMSAIEREASKCASEVAQCWCGRHGVHDPVAHAQTPERP
jgi:hypothetical protein